MAGGATKPVAGAADEDASVGPITEGARPVAGAAGAGYCLSTALFPLSKPEDLKTDISPRKKNKGLREEKSTRN